MVRDRLPDGDRIAEVLRAEIDGRETAGLERFSIETTGDDTTIVCDESPLAEIVPRETGVEMRFPEGTTAVRSAAEHTSLEVEETEGPVVVVVDSAAETKAAVDLLVAVVDRLP
ncbi:hypothetical protein [Halorhabdus sp. CUG00001]|uniref:hypothetical protein n=1 Tax=Halorhabdus sp. CUG00001 TaxID=2600297 RepID=UPI00131E33EB|nr:hypothetical protein [Halorhabdus sp. CUG00001]